MKTHDMIELLDARTLESALHFWNAGRADWPAGEKDRRARLEAFLHDREIVEDRFARLPPRLQEIAAYVVRSIEWAAPFDVRALDLAHLSIDETEAHAALAALVERGFFAVGRVRMVAQHRQLAYVIPEELGYALEAILDAQKRPMDASLTLRSHLRYLGKTDGDLPKLPKVASRKARISDPALAEIWDTLVDAGGILDGDARARNGIEADVETLERWGRELESLHLGSFEARDLTNHGIRVKEGWLIVYQEVVEEELAAAAADPDEADAHLVRSPDILADLSRLASDVESSPFKRKKDGSFMKGTMKRLAAVVLSPGFHAREPEEDIEWAIGFMVASDFLTFGPDGQARLTPRWRAWEKRSPSTRIKDVLAYAVSRRSGEFSSFHLQALRKGVLKELKDGGADRWFRLTHPAIIARNRYLREAVRGEHARQYQEFHKQASFPQLASPDMMLRALNVWIMEDLTAIGLVETAVRRGETRPWAVRLTALGGVLVGLRAEAADGVRTGLVVNPDHEIVVFPDSANYDLLQKVSRFATRVKADWSVHYKLTKESVQSGVASGLSSDFILKLLADSSGRPVPQNVAFSIEEWCKNVQKISARRTWLLEMPGRTAGDAVVAIPELKEVIVRRLSPSVVEIREDPSQAGIVQALREHGFYLG